MEVVVEVIDSYPCASPAGNLHSHKSSLASLHANAYIASMVIFLSILACQKQWRPCAISSVQVTPPRGHYPAYVHVFRGFLVMK